MQLFVVSEGSHVHSLTTPFVTFNSIEITTNSRTPLYTDGGVAQMVERSLSMREVPGSIPGASNLFYYCCVFEQFNHKNLHRPGIEPGPPAWQASILPLNQRCFIKKVINIYVQTDIY